MKLSPADFVTDAANIFGGALGLVIVVALLILWISWVLLPFLILNSLGKLRMAVEKSNALAATQADQLTKTLETLDRELAEASRATAVEVADSNFTLDEIHKTLLSLDAHLTTMERDGQHTHRLLEWVGQKTPGNQTGSS